MKIIKSYNTVIDKINKYLHNTTKEMEIFFGDGFFIKLKKRTKNGNLKIEIHTSGYDDILEANEAINWIQWTLYDYKGNGILI